MIAGVERNGGICIVFRTKREGLRVIASTYCEGRENAAEGVVQVPAKAITCEPCKDGVEKITGHAFDE